MSTSRSGGLRMPRRPAGEGRRRASALLGGVAVVAVALAGMVALRWDERGAGGLQGAYDGAPPPVTRAADGSFVMAWGDEKAPLLEIFTDYQCPDCKDAHDEVGPLLRRLASQGRVRVVYRPIQVYRGTDGGPSASNSRRAGNAALCAPAAGWLAYHEALFEHQPDEDTAGFEPDELIAIGERAGISGPSFPACVTGGGQNARLDELTRYAFSVRGVREPPAAFLDGRRLDDSVQRDAARLERAIHTARRP